MPNAKPLTFMGVPIAWDVGHAYADKTIVFMTLGGKVRAYTPKETPVSKPVSFFIDDYKRLLGKPKKLPPYRTVGVRFIHGHNLLKVYTYRVRKAAKVHLGQEVIVESNPPTGWTKSLAVIVRIDATPQDNGPYDYLWIEQSVKPL